jgi:hypothetical protein
MSQTIFTTCNPIAEDCALFQNPGRTIPAEPGVYWDGTNCWEVGFDGVVTAQGTCATTTTTSTTTTTTTAGSGFYYEVGQVLCGACPDPTATLIAYSPIALTINRFFNPGDGYVYKVGNTVSGPSFDVDLTGAFGDTTNCNIACGG